MALETYETVDEDGQTIRIYGNGDAFYANGKPAIEKVIEPDHHRFTPFTPARMERLAEARGVAV